MPVFASYDGTEIGYRVLGDGPPLVCLPGGPGRAAEYLGDLGGVSASRQLILLTPGLAAVGVGPAEEQVRAALARRSAERWYPVALAAMEKFIAGDLSA